MPVQDRLAEAVKSAMRARDKERLAALRLISAEIKQREVDRRERLDEPAVLAVLSRMIKQRQESIGQFEAAGRADLVARERAEMAVIREFLPAPLDAGELAALVEAAIAETGAASLRDMGRVMGWLKPRTEGRADAAAVAARVKARLASG